MRDHKKAEELAAQRFQLISPLLAEGLDAGKVKELKDQIARPAVFQKELLDDIWLNFVKRDLED